MIDRIIDWLCARLGLCIRFDGDLMTPDCPDDAPDPHYRRPAYMTTPRQHVAVLWIDDDGDPVELGPVIGRA